MSAYRKHAKRNHRRVLPGYEREAYEAGKRGGLGGDFDAWWAWFHRCRDCGHDTSHETVHHCPARVCANEARTLTTVAQLDQAILDKLAPLRVGTSAEHLARWTGASEYDVELALARLAEAGRVRVVRRTKSRLTWGLVT